MSDFLWCHEFLVNEALREKAVNYLQLGLGRVRSVVLSVVLPHPMSLLQCAQASGEHSLIRGEAGQSEAHRLLPAFTIWRWPSRTCKEKECQEGPGWCWRR